MAPSGNFDSMGKVSRTLRPASSKSSTMKVINILSHKTYPQSSFTYSLFQNWKKKKKSKCWFSEVQMRLSFYLVYNESDNDSLSSFRGVEKCQNFELYNLCSNF